MKCRREKCLLLCASVLLAALLLADGGAQRAETRCYQMQMEAVRLLEECFAHVRSYKWELGIPIEELDYHGTGMIGESYTGITTTLGAVEAKRTAAWPEMGALCVRMLYEAGIRPGDTVGAGFSGSFPGMNLAVAAACEAMDVRLICISSVGASTYGANNEQLTFPEMLHRLKEDGVLQTDSTAVTLGGDGDILAEAEPSLVAEITKRIEATGLTLLYEPDFSENLRRREEIYQESGPIHCFIAVGGNLSSMGRGEEGIGLGQGILMPSQSIRLTENSGLVQRYLSNGTTVINLLNLKKIMSDYSLPYDPEQWPETGISAVYYETQYPLQTIAAGLAVASGLLVAFAWKEKRERKTPDYMVLLGEGWKNGGKTG